MGIDESDEVRGNSTKMLSTARAGHRMNTGDLPSPPAAMAHPQWSLANMVSVASALMFGQGVSSERRAKRLAICLTCDKLVNSGVAPRCGICGCKLRGRSSALVDLLRYEETPRYGCKHPKGSRWKAKGV